MFDVSVIVPTYNRAAMLRACLEALGRQTLPRAEFEVLVVIDGSTDDTPAVLAGMTTPYALRVLSQAHGGQHTARNAGIAAANGEFCLFLDDDVVADPGLVAEHLAAQRHHGGAVVIGRIDLDLPSGADAFVRTYAEGWRHHFAHLEATRSPGWMDFYGGNVSVPRSVLLALGGFTPELPRCHDVELGYRLARAALPFVYAGRAGGRQVEHKDGLALAKAFELSGSTWLTLYERHPGTLPHLLGSFNAARRREVMLRRLLLAFDVPPGLLALAGRLLPRGRVARRWYFFLHRYCYWRGVRRSNRNRETWRRLTSSTAVLMYHAFAEHEEPASRYVVPARRFAAQLRWLKRLGFRPLTLEQYLVCLRERRLPPPRAVVITIDDGYADARTVALPILRRYGFPATVFVVTQAVGLTNQWSTRRELAGRRLLSWSEIRALADQNMAFGAHTRTHPLLPSLPVARARDEIAGSRADLEREIGGPVVAFAYPYGAYDPTVESVVRETGLYGACRADGGLSHPGMSPYAIRRVAVHGGDSLVRFAVKLWLGDAAGRRDGRAEDAHAPNEHPAARVSTLSGSASTTP